MCLLHIFCRPLVSRFACVSNVRSIHATELVTKSFHAFKQASESRQQLNISNVTNDFGCFSVIIRTVLENPIFRLFQTRNEKITTSFGPHYGSVKFTQRERFSEKLLQIWQNTELQQASTKH